MNPKTVTLLFAFLASFCLAGPTTVANCKGDPGQFFKINSYKVEGSIVVGGNLTVTANVTYYKSTTILQTKIVAYFSFFKVYDAVDSTEVVVEKGTTDLVNSFDLPPQLEKGDYRVQTTFFDDKQLQCIEMKFTVA